MVISCFNNYKVEKRFCVNATFIGSLKTVKKKLLFFTSLCQQNKSLVYYNILDMKTKIEN